MNLSIEFQESYKRLDRLCKEILSSSEGVSAYIKQMEAVAWADRKNVVSWENDYKKLKHVRWVRNQLAHEVGAFEAGVCALEDLNYTEDFYQRILEGVDPFSLMRKEKERAREEQRSRERQTQRPAFSQEKSAVKKTKKQSLFGKIFSKIKKWFNE